MIPNHTRFIEAIHAKKKVCVRFYSQADSGVLDRVCAPMDYGPGGEFKDGLNRYWLWDYGTFGRSFSLPDDASPAKVSAEFKDGVLTVHLVKDEKAKPQQVEVKVS
jgi:Hsp20/alpha crystallin family